MVVLGKATQGIGQPRGWVQWCSALSMMLLVGLGSGCAGPRHSTPSVDQNELSDEGFQAYLAEIDLVTVDEAYRAMLILADGEDPCESFEERQTVLESRGIVRSNWGLIPENVIDAGSVSYMICQICKIRGGLSFNLFGKVGLGDRRYALRELEYREMIDDKVDYQYVTGASLVGLMAKADALMEKKGLYDTEMIELSDETDRDEHGELIVPEPSEGG